VVLTAVPTDTRHHNLCQAIGDSHFTRREWATYCLGIYMEVVHISKVFSFIEQKVCGHLGQEETGIYNTFHPLWERSVRVDKKIQVLRE